LDRKGKGKPRRRHGLAIMCNSESGTVSISCLDLGIKGRAGSLCGQHRMNAAVQARTGLGLRKVMEHRQDGYLKE
jgi:hypothetical protein